MMTFLIVVLKGADELYFNAKQIKEFYAPAAGGLMIWFYDGEKSTFTAEEMISWRLI